MIKVFTFFKAWAQKSGRFCRMTQTTEMSLVQSR